MKNSYSLCLSSIRSGVWFLVVAFIMIPLSTAAQEDWEDHHCQTGWFPWHRNPTLSVMYGFIQPSLDDLVQPYSSERQIDVRMGWSWMDALSTESGVTKYGFTYGYVSGISTNLGATTAPGEVSSEVWRFGGAWDRGYAYSFGDRPESQGIILYHSEGWAFSTVHGRGPYLSASDSALFAVFEGALRFGVKAEGGLRFQLMPLLSVDAGYERMAVFRRHLFWEWLGSALLEGAAGWLVDRFVGRVEDSSPLAVPVVYFVLRNALSYGVYQLRSQKMNFPFDSEPAMMFDGFRVGMTFVF